MKRVFVFYLLAIITASLNAQHTTTVSGRLLTPSQKSISLAIRSFQTDKLLGPGDNDYRQPAAVKAVILPDSTYLIETGDVIRPFTSCELIYGSKKIELILSPGDSLVIDLEYWSFNTSVNLSGKGAEKNIYWNSPERAGESERVKEIGKLYGKDRIGARSRFRDSQLELLNSYLGQALVDTAFYEWESKRINYDCLDSHVRYSLWHNLRYAEKFNEPVGIYNELNPGDEGAILTIASYRSLIRNYLDFIARENPEKPKWDLNEIFESGQSKFKGLVKSYFLWHSCDRALDEAIGDKEKELIREFAYNKIDDPLVKSMLTPISGKKSGGSGPQAYLSEGLYTISLIMIAIFLLAIGFNLYRNYRLSKARSLNVSPHIIWKFLLILAFLVFCLYFIKEESLEKIWNFVFLLSLVVFIIIHNVIMIPRLLIRKKLFAYGLSMAALLAAFFFVVFFMIQGSYKPYYGNDFSEYVIPVFLFSSVLLILYSYTYFYVSLISKKRKGMSWLIDQGYLNLEALVHALLISLIFIVAALNIESASESLIVLYLISGMAIFYLAAFWLVPKHLFKKEYGLFLLYSLSVFIGISLIIAVSNGLITFFHLQGRGLEVPFRETLRFPGMTIFVLAVPAVLYAYARKIIKERENRGISLFRQKEAELNQLRSQVNPHFLFNSLNSVYAFALKEGNEKTAESIAKLANLMRYLIDDMEKEKIPVKKEIDYIEDYIKLQLIRSSAEHKISMNIELDENQESKMIAPMLMIPLVENAFKHGINPNTPSELKLKASFIGKQFQFVLENSVDKNFEAFYKEKGFGIGIENIRKRLEYIYPGRHKLSIADTGDRFIVIMEILLNSNK